MVFACYTRLVLGRKKYKIRLVDGSMYQFSQHHCGTMNFFNFFISFVAFAVVIVVGQQQHDPNYCYATDPIRPQLGRFSSRTAYETIRGRVINPGVSSNLKNKLIQH